MEPLLVYQLWYPDQQQNSAHGRLKQFDVMMSVDWISQNTLLRASQHTHSTRRAYGELTSAPRLPLAVDQNVHRPDAGP
jgi:hypothetical protein